MGGSGGDYSSNVNYVRQASSTHDFSDVSAKIADKHEPNKSVLPKNFKDIEIYAGQDIVIVAIDGTGSMGNDTFIIRDKIVLLDGQLRIQGYLKNPLVMIVMVGDAFSDRYPIQIAKPERGDALIEEIEKTWPEGNGGGQGKESYELTAYYLLNHMKLNDTNAKPYLFFLGDEGIHNIDASQVKEHIGDTISNNLTTSEVFKNLCKKFKVYRLHREYQGYNQNNQIIIKQWKDMIGNENVQLLTKPKEVVDDILGIVAVGTKSRTIDGYIKDMKDRGQTQERIDAVRKVLISVRTEVIPIKDVPKLPTIQNDTQKRISGKTRL